MRNKVQIFFFVIIFLIGVFLRFYKISSIPPGVNRDEASIGYTAYSLINTGRDEYGRFLPLSFQSFGDWKLPVYIYETVVTTKIFGLSAFAVRLPSAMAGSLAFVLVFFLVKKLFKSDSLALLTMFLAAISPWSLHLSRVESESNTAVMLTLIALLFFIKGLRKNIWFIISSVFFALCYFTYAGNYVSTTLLVLGLAIFFRKEIRVNKYSVFALAVFLLLSMFIWRVTIGANTTKLSGIGIFGDPSIVHAQIEIPRNQHNNPGSLLARLVHNRVVFAVERFGQNYINGFSPQFLFIKGGTNSAHNIQNFGNMYLIEAPLFFLGLIYLIAYKKGKERNLILWWIIISPIAAAITKDAPHTNRMFAAFPALQIVVAFGIFLAITSFKKQWRNFIIFILALAYLFNILIYLDRYYVHFPYNETGNWGNGYKLLVKLLSGQEYANKSIIMSEPQTSPYIYLNFYDKYDPALYEKQAIRYPLTEDGFLHVKSFGKYQFRSIDWNKDLHDSNNVVIDFSKNVPDFVKHDYTTKEIILPDSESMFTVVLGK